MDTAKTEIKPAAKRSARRLSISKSREDALVKEAAGIVRTTTAALREGAATAERAVSTDLTSELNNIDFKKMIAGPLQAAVDAQIASSMATIQFINEVGFRDNGGTRELVMVDFSHKRDGVDAEGKPVSKDVSIRVPLLAMLPIPSLRIEQVIIDFNVKLNSVETSATSQSFSLDSKVKGGFGPVKFKVSASYKRQSSTGVEVKKEYALNVNVKAVQDEIPAGLDEILKMLAA